MNDGELPQVIELVRRLKAAPTGVDEERLTAFLRRVNEGRLPIWVASQLAWAIAESGTQLPTKRFSPVSSVHSTGAPGSLSTLLSPVLLSTCGCYVPLLSVRGSVHGAIDTLAAIPGYNAKVGAEQFTRILGSTRLAHGEHTDEFAPADRVLWNLRGQVGAKEEPTLIAASLLGKKLAAGAMSGSIDVRVGEAGNAGHTREAAFETAWAIVNAAQHLGMRISCILSDATRLPWPYLGPTEALLSLWEVLTEPDRFTAHPHIRMCKEVAAAAGHAACPLDSLDDWRRRIDDALSSGKAKEQFVASIQAHGTGAQGVEEVRERAAKRRTVSVEYEGVPDPRGISNLFKTLRQQAEGSQHGIGLAWKENEKRLEVYVPRDAGVGDEAIRELVTSKCPAAKVAAPIPTTLLSFDGQILSPSDR